MVFVVVVVVVLTLTRIIIKSVVTGQAPVTLELAEEYRRGKTQTKGGTHIDYMYIITADAIHASTRNI